MSKPKLDFGTNELKQLLLTAIIVKTYVDEFPNFKDQSEKQEYSIHQLLKFVEEYNEEHYKEHYPGRKAKQDIDGNEIINRQLTRGMGGGYRIYEINQLQNKSELIEQYNSLIKYGIAENSYSKTLELLEKKLDKKISLGVGGEEEAQNKLASLTFYKLYAEFTFPWIHDYTFNLVVDNGPTRLKDNNIESFIKSKSQLKDCIVTLRVSPFRKLKPLQAKVKTGSIKTSIIAVDPIYKLPSERYIGHYLSPNKKLTGAEIELFWEGEILKGVILRQLQGFIIYDRPLTFHSKLDYIQTPIGGKSYFITLESDIKKDDNRPITFMQIAIEKKASEPPHRTGFFSSILITIKDNAKESKEWATIPIGGGVILQQIPRELDIGFFLKQLELGLQQSKELGINQKDYSELIWQAWSIRYRLLNKLVTIQANNLTQSDYNWNLLQRYVGTYTCYYMRLVEKPPCFESSRIVVNPDGTATLQQHHVSDTTDGYVKVKENRLWFYFGEDEITEKEPVRFLVYNTRSERADPQLIGIFQSETLQGKVLVSGRMLMRMHTGPKQIAPLFSIPHTDLEYSQLEPDLLAFFTDDTESHRNLTDGPYWQMVAERFKSHEDRQIINDLRKIGAHFYYYIFKNAGTDNEKEYILERNRIIFYENGTVVLNSAYCDYEGTASYQRKTIKLSLIDKKKGNGFLEIFLDYNPEQVPSPKESLILYGASLWHSGNRIESKAIVLSRVESFIDGEWVELAKETKTLRFLPTEEAQQELEKLDVQTRGIVGYLRGEHNRYLQIPRQISRRLSYTEMRPRDKETREPYFMAACYLGSLITGASKFAKKQNAGIPYRFIADTTEASTVPDLGALLEACMFQLKQAYLHGYACDFAGLKLDPERAIKDKDYVMAEYQKSFPTVVLRAPYFINTVTRIQEIAAEQLDLKAAFAPEGPLDSGVLRVFAIDYWPKLLKKFEDQDTSSY